MQQHVLLIEDSRTQALRLQLELMRHGLTVEIASTGERGLAAVRDHHPAAIILDIDLPDTTGYHLCRTIKEDPATAHIPIVMLTHRDAAQDALAGLQVGAEDYIPKDSFAEQNLIASLRQLKIL
ncbi:MAG: PleD family two-component system response regulator [Roseiflexaceae bacterium]